MPLPYESARAFHDKLDARRANFLTEWQDVVDLILPHAGNTNRLESPGERRGYRRYSSVAVQACKDFSSLMAATVTNAAQRWFLWELKNSQLREVKGIRDWFDEANKRGREVLNDSNFYQLIQVAYKDFGGMGTSTMWLQEKSPRPDGSFGGVFFTLPSAREYCVQEGPEGVIDTVTRMWRMDASSAVRRFQEEPGAVSIHRDWMEKAQNKDGQQGLAKVPVLHTCMPNGELWESTYYDAEHQQVLANAFYREQPFACARFDLTSEDEGWGRGAGMELLPDVRSLNEQKRLELRGLEKDIDPPLIAHSESVLGRADAGAGKMIWLKAGAQPPSYLLSGTRFDISKFKTDEAKEIIYAAFYLSEVRMLTSARPGNMSEQEYLSRTQQALERIGPMYFRLTHEFLDILLMRLFSILMRRGEFPPLPAEMQDLARRGYDLSLQVGYTGPIARAQRMVEHRNTSEFLGFGVQLAQGTGQLDAIDWIDTDEAMQQAHELLGAPSKVLRGKREVEEIRERRAQEQQAAALAAQMADTLGGGVGSAG